MQGTVAMNFTRAVAVCSVGNGPPDPWALVAIVKWEGPHTPSLDWTTFRRWKREPTEERLQKAQAAALARPRFFRTCSICHELNNAGHMHDDHICQGCAERHLGVVH